MQTAVVTRLGKAVGVAEAVAVGVGVAVTDHPKSLLLQGAAGFCDLGNDSGSGGATIGIARFN
jgi:hypothetical protein